MKFTMSVDMDNAAFESPVELGDILAQVGDKVMDERYHVGHTESILDTNGNRVGSWKIAEED